MNKNRLNRIDTISIPQFQLKGKGSLMNKNRLNRIPQFIALSLLVAGFVLLPVSRPVRAAGTAGTDAFGTNGANGTDGADGASADGAPGGTVGGGGGIGGGGGRRPGGRKLVATGPVG